MAKTRPYKVIDKVDKVQTVVRATSKATAVAFMVKGRYEAEAASANDCLDYIAAHPGVVIETAGEDAEATGP